MSLKHIVRNKLEKLIHSGECFPGQDFYRVLCGIEGWIHHLGKDVMKSGYLIGNQGFNKYSYKNMPSISTFVDLIIVVIQAELNTYLQ